MNCPAEHYKPAQRSYHGLPDIDYPMHDRAITVTACGRGVPASQKNMSLRRQGSIYQRLCPAKHWEYAKPTSSIWLVRFMHYDLGYIDLEEKTLQTIDNPFNLNVLPMS